MSAIRTASILVVLPHADGWELRFSDTDSLILPHGTAQTAARFILGLPPLPVTEQTANTTPRGEA